MKEFRGTKRRPGLGGAVRDLFHRKYTATRAVDDISFSIEPGEMVGYIGPNGAGKSTSVKMLTGILTPSSGEVRANGFIPYKQRMSYAATIGAVFGQRTQLWWDIPVTESFRLLKEIYSVSDSDYAARIQQFNDILGLHDYMSKPVRKLSLGERMRCDMAAALLHNPPLLFLDEPTIGLDLLAKEAIRKFLKEINQAYGTTMLLTTHDLADIEELCDRLILIDHGRILFDGPLGELKTRLGNQSQVRFDLKNPEQATAIESLDLDGVAFEKDGPLTCVLVFARDRYGTGDLIRQVVGVADVRDIVVEEESIESIIRRIYMDNAVLESKGD